MMDTCKIAHPNMSEYLDPLPDSGNRRQLATSRPADSIAMHGARNPNGSPE